MKAFAVGQMATGAQFIGRAKEAQDLSSLFETSASSSFHLVGATRIGKSSLVEKVFAEHASDDGVLEIRLDLSVFENAFQFWSSLCEEIVDGINSKRIKNPRIRKHKKDLLSMRQDDANWYAKMRRPLTRTLDELKKSGFKVVVALDEFDAAPRIFEGNAAYFQMLRSLFSEDNAFNGVVISRRNMEVLEAKADAVSTLHGVFDTLRLNAFDASEMDEFYSVLQDAGVSMGDEGREQFLYFTGGIPYLCCMLGNQLLSSVDSNNPREIEPADIIEAHKVCQPEIWRYYNDLVTRLEEDGHLEPLVYLAFDEMRTLSYEHNRNNMISMAYLVEQKKPDGTCEYYAYSQGFMAYLRRQPLNIPTWDLLSASEKKLKEIFALEYPLFSEIRPIDSNGTVSQNDKDAVTNQYPELRFRTWQKYESYLKNAASYMENPVVLDVLLITWVIDEVLFFWERGPRCFASHFGNDASWKNKLSEIRRVRDPMAHAHGGCIPDDDLARVNRYMQELLLLDV